MMQGKHPILLGAHMSIAGGYEKAIERGQSIHCTAIQIFTKSNRQWRANPITDQQAETFAHAWQHSSIKSIVAHAMYLLNLASPDPKLWHGTIAAVKEELERCHALGIAYLIVHPGARLTAPLQEGLSRVIEAVNRALDQAQGTTSILLENMAGQGSSVCSSIEELAIVLEGVENKSRVGVCIDTCHAFATGYDLRISETYTNFWNLFDQAIGIKKLKALHLNDSKKELGAHVDRHEEIGKG